MISRANGLAMTDLFISATAALLMVLAVSQPHEPQPRPIQADLLATCVAGPEDAPIKEARVWRADREADTAHSVTRAKDLATLPTQLELTAKPYYLVGVVPNTQGILSGRCQNFIANDLAKTRNAKLHEIARSDASSRAVFVVSLFNDEPQNGE